MFEYIEMIFRVFPKTISTEVLDYKNCVVDSKKKKWLDKHKKEKTDATQDKNMQENNNNNKKIE